MGGAVDHAGLHARLTPERLAARDLKSGRAFSWAELDRAAGRFAAAFAARRLKQGDRVALLARNRIACILVHLACARQGLIYVPLNWRLAAAEIAALIADAEPALLLGDESLEAAGFRGLDLSDLEDESDELAPAPLAAIDRDRPSLILYTSGTSGRPKGALLSERNIEATAINFSLLGAVDRNSVFLVDAPMFHIIGLITSVRPVMMRGGCFLVSDGFSPPRTLERMADPALGITHYFCVPQMAAALRAEAAYDPARLRGLTAIFTGGAPHPESAIRAWLKDGIAIVDGYGMSEAGTVFGMPLDLGQIAAHAGSAGIATPGVQSRIVDAQGRACAAGETGELLLKGDAMTSGYWRRPEETRAAFTGDGWFRTGDLVRADPDGFHWIVDRAKDMFISGGENIYPAEIEAQLAGHPEIAECAVVGVPDERWGEVGHLFVVAAPGACPEPARLLAELEGRLARYKLPKHVSLIAALPRNGAGKVLKKDLKGMGQGEGRAG